MKANYAAVAALAGIGIGGLAVHSVHAQTAPRAYAIIDIDVTDQQGFVKEYAPLAGKIITDGGGKYLARGGKTVAIEGTAPKRLTLIEFPSLEGAGNIYIDRLQRSPQDGRQVRQEIQHNRRRGDSIGFRNHGPARPGGGREPSSFFILNPLFRH